MHGLNLKLVRGTGGGERAVYLGRLIRLVKEYTCSIRQIVDCTSSCAVADQYADFCAKVSMW